MKKRKKKSLKFIKSSVATLEALTENKIVGGSSAVSDCNSFRSACINSCWSH